MMKKLTTIILALVLIACLGTPTQGAGFITKKYYVDDSGNIIKGYKKINGDKYYFNKQNGEFEGRIMKITYINQSKGVRKNKKWKNTGFCKTRTRTGKTIAMAGCGITSCAMAITALRGKLTLPTKFNSAKYGFNGKGSNWNVGLLTAKKYKLKAKVRSLSKNQAKQQILKGRFILVWVTNSIYGGGGNTSGGDVGHGGGHFVLIHGYKNGKFAVADPNNLSQTYVWSKKLQTWENFADHLGNGKNKSFTVIWK